MVAQLVEQVRHWRSVHPIGSFVVFEMIATTVGLLLLATFVVHCALFLMPHIDNGRTAKATLKDAPVKNRSGAFEDYARMDALTLIARTKDFKLLLPLLSKFALEDSVAFGRGAARSATVDPAAESSDTRVGYVSWLGRLAAGDLGAGKEGDVANELANELPITASLCLSAYVCSACLGILVALVRCAYRESRAVASGFYLFLLAGSLPAFLLGYVFLGIMQYNRDLSLVVPIVVLTFSSGVITEMARIVAQAMDRELAEDYVKTARVKGLSQWRGFVVPLPLPGSVAYHAFREAAVQFLPQLARRAPQVVGMGLVVEKVFNLSGLSVMLLQGLDGHEDARVLAVVVFSVLLVQVCSWLTSIVRMSLGQRLVSHG